MFNGYLVLFDIKQDPLIIHTEIYTVSDHV